MHSTGNTSTNPTTTLTSPRPPRRRRASCRTGTPSRLFPRARAATAAAAVGSQAPPSPPTSTSSAWPACTPRATSASPASSRWCSRSAPRRNSRPKPPTCRAIAARTATPTWSHVSSIRMTFSGSQIDFVGLGFARPNSSRDKTPLFLPPQTITLASSFAPFLARSVASTSMPTSSTASKRRGHTWPRRARSPTPSTPSGAWSGSSASAPL